MRRKGSFMPNLSHLKRMTDDNGMLQFSKKAIPDHESGYTLDDNARALIIAIDIQDGESLARIYANNLRRAQRPDGSWANFFLAGRYNNYWDSEDSIGRALLACSLAGFSPWEEIREVSSFMLKSQLYRVENFTSPRAIAYSILALSKGILDNEKLNLVHKLSDLLISLYQQKSGKAWCWFEDYLTYCNGILPQAMLSSYQVTGDKKALKIGRDSLNFLCGVLFRRGYLNIIGNRGWYQRGGSVPLFDQQPVDAASIALACQAAYQVLGANEYREMSKTACDWYKGKNIHNIPMVDDNSGGCFDALTPEGVNLNQGAEAVISYILSEQLINNSMFSSPEPVDSSLPF